MTTATATETAGIDLDALARKIATRLDPAALLDAEDLAALWKYAKRTVLEDLAKRSWFPKPVDLGGGQPRWMRADILACLEERRTKAAKKPGRPRL